MSLMRIFAMVLLFSLCGCNSSHQPSLAEDLQAKDSSARVSAEAARFLGSLHQQGKLPGLAKDEHGALKASVSDYARKVEFPATFSFQFTKSDGSVLHYTVQKEAAGTDWRLMKAWQTDASGKVLREFPSQ